jgi:hypothetical protein
MSETQYPSLKVPVQFTADEMDFFAQRNSGVLLLGGQKKTPVLVKGLSFQADGHQITF